MIVYPTDHGLLNTAREESERMIDLLYAMMPSLKTKPRTYRRIARKEFVFFSKKKNKTRKQIRKAGGFSRINHFSRDAYNESTDLEQQVEDYFRLRDFYPEVLLGDGIYLTRAKTKETSESWIANIFFAYPKPEQTYKRCIWTNRALEKYFQQTKKSEPKFLF